MLLLLFLITFSTFFLYLFTGISRLDDQIFINRNPGVPSVVKFHPFNTCIAVADKDSIWWEIADTSLHTSKSRECHVYGNYIYFFFLTPVASGTGRRARGWTTSTTETPVTPASRPWSTSTATTALYCSPQQVGHVVMMIYFLFYFIFIYLFRACKQQ